MRYTPEATMESRGLRDVDRWKDKIEVRLDNRQVAFLFFGSALVACLLFILGVIVGKRLESRGRAMSPEIEDPLALLDRVASSTAAAGAESVAPVSRGLLGASKASASAPAPRPKASAAAELAIAKVEPAKSEKAPEKASEKPSERPVEKVAERPLQKVAVPAEPAPSDKAPVAKVDVGPASAPKPVKSAVVPPPVTEGALAAETTKSAAAKPKRRYSLQISSFQDRAEADAFAQGFGAERPFVTTSDLGPKGVWFRVRVGEYGSYEEAVAAKADFERRHNKIALVVGPL